MPEYRKTSKIKIIFTLSCIFYLVNAFMNFTFAQPLTPPLTPDVPPLISYTYSSNLDGDKIDDQINRKINQGIFLSNFTTTNMNKNDIVINLNQTVDVELIFKEQITQNQINKFLLLGGQISYIYKAVSYGWIGRISLDKIEMLPEILGPSLVNISQPKASKPSLDVATQTGRVRPVWKAGFAESLNGFSGGENITIGIIDSGIDSNHVDFDPSQIIHLDSIVRNDPIPPEIERRCLFWKDFSPENIQNPVDYGHHGSFVTGIAWGKGLAQEMDAMFNNGLFWTDYSEPNEWWCGPSPASLPIWDVTLKSIVYFTDTRQDFAFGTREYITTGETLTWWIHSEFTSGTLIGPTPVMSDEGRACGVIINGAKNAVIANMMSPYYVRDDSFNRLRGVAPDCRLACAKVGLSTEEKFRWTYNALDELIYKRRELNLRVLNISWSTLEETGKDDIQRQKCNSAVNNGIVLVVSAGNNGDKDFPEIHDPGRAAMVLTVGASNDKNQLTEYSSIGFSDPDSTNIAKQEGYKPDVIAPGGSDYYSYIMSVDSGTSDGLFWDDLQQYDYGNVKGTSLSTPFVAGCAALVIEAIEKSDQNFMWDFYSNDDARFVKMVLCATATETIEQREDANDVFSPTLQRAERGPMGYPEGKDPYEGYGIINPDAAIEAVFLEYNWDLVENDTFDEEPDGRRAWARNVNLSGGVIYNIILENPQTGDFDLYLYDKEPSPTGTPQILAHSTESGLGIDENIRYTPLENKKALLVVKRVSGSGTFTLDSF
jgi:subtilisin family serine protease